MHTCVVQMRFLELELDWLRPQLIWNTDLEWLRSQRIWNVNWIAFEANGFGA